MANNNETEEKEKTWVPNTNRCGGI
jgi:hypothetical protein